jgi:hypothetical protein
MIDLLLVVDDAHAFHTELLRRCSHFTTPYPVD